MRRFHCPQCAAQVFFENTHCEGCASALAFDPGRQAMICVGAMASLCVNRALGGCNWIAAGEGKNFCRACRHNRTIPDLNVGENLSLWRACEAAKRRLFYSLLRLGLPLRTRSEDPTHGLAFDCVDDSAGADGHVTRAMTGHENGVITMALAEADAVKREDRRAHLGEAYRTVLGHLRHEVGHYYWDLLISGKPSLLGASRALFGDDRDDYAEAMSRYYAQGPRPDWSQSFVSAYASAHAFEDFAESWAHYFHIVDVLETARGFDIAVDSEARAGVIEPPADAYHAPAIAMLLEAWTPLTLAVNCLNRAMGQPDLYPFVLPAPAIAKLEFIRGVIASAGAARALAA